MADQTGKLTCTLWCFALGALAGALATIMLVLLGGFGWNGAVFTGVLLALGLGLFLKVAFCRPLPTMAEIRAKSAADHAPAPVAQAQAAASKPVFMTAARAGRPDDLKVIKGVGPKLEEMLHGMGVFHFDQIAAWTAAEVAWVDDNLEGFKGRVSRDEWVTQARFLAAGGSV